MMNPQTASLANTKAATQHFLRHVTALYQNGVSSFVGLLRPTPALFTKII